jgi:hypothetical protein
LIALPMLSIRLTFGGDTAGRKTLLAVADQVIE